MELRIENSLTYEPYYDLSSRKYKIYFSGKIYKQQSKAENTK